MESQTVWRGSTMQDRATERRERLVAAAYQLVGTEGAAAATVRAVCREAQLSRNYFYENFTDREDLLRALADRVAEEMREFVVAVPRTGGLYERVVAVFEAAANYLDADSRRVRIILREFVADDTLREHANRSIPGFFVLVAAHFADVLPEPVIDPSRPEKFTIGGIQIYGAVSATFLSWLEGRIDATRGELARECADLVMAVFALPRR